MVHIIQLSDIAFKRQWIAAAANLAVRTFTESVVGFAFVGNARKTSEKKWQSVSLAQHVKYKQ